MSKMMKMIMSVLFIAICILFGLVTIQEERKRKIEEIDKMDLKNMKMIEYTDDM